MTEKITFEEFIENRIGIKPPRTWIPFQKKRKAKEICEEWEYVHRAYLKLIAKYEEEKQKWEKTSEKLFEDCGAQMPEFPATSYSALELSKNPEESYAAIFEASYLLDSVKTIEISEELRRDAIEKWWNEVLENVPDGCKLIILKNEDYCPEEKTIKQFEKSVAQNKPSKITFWGLIQWVAIEPKDWMGAFYIKNSCISIKKVKVVYQ